MFELGAGRNVPGFQLQVVFSGLGPGSQFQIELQTGLILLKKHSKRSMSPLLKQETFIFAI